MEGVEDKRVVVSGIGCRLRRHREDGGMQREEDES